MILAAQAVKARIDLCIFRLSVMRMENPDPSNAAARPPLLLILAVLTVLWSLFTLVGGLLPSEDFSGWSEGMPQSPGWVTALTMVSAVIKGGGAVLLLLMRRWGFYAYLAGELLTTALNIKTGFDLMTWSGETNTSAMAINPALMAVGLVGGMLLLSVIWVGAFAHYLPRLR